MSEWKEYKLGDITSRIGDGLHGTPKYDFDGAYYFINGNNILNGKIVIKEDTRKVNSKEFLLHAKPLSDRTILISINGTIGNIGLYDGEKCMLGKSACYVNLINGVDRQFIYYSFVNYDFQEFLNRIATGTTIPNVPLKGLREFIIKLPSLPDQERIAGILSSLDDKIDLLSRQNATLEAMAETLFRQFFIENPKEDWKPTTLGEYVICINGVSHKSDDLNVSITAMATLKSFHRAGGFKLDGYKEYTGGYKPNQTINEGDLLVAHTDITQDAAVIGNPVLVISHPKYDTLTFSMDLVKVEPIDYLSREVLYLLMKSTNFKEHCLGYANGSTVLHLSKKAIPEFEFIMPKPDLVEKLQKGVAPLVDKLFANHKQILTLTQLRDTLLPKLMNNEIKIY